MKIKTFFKSPEIFRKKAFHRRANNQFCHGTTVITLIGSGVKHWIPAP